MIGLIVIAWLGWIGPRALNNTDGGWFGAIAAGHGLVDVLLAGLCAAGTSAGARAWRASLRYSCSRA